MKFIWRVKRKNASQVTTENVLIMSPRYIWTPIDRTHTKKKKSHNNPTSFLKVKKKKKM